MPGSKVIHVGAKTVEMLKDPPDYSKWSDEELLAGRQYDSRGRMVGRAPKVIPLQLLHELTMRRSTYATKKFANSLKPIADYLTGVAEGTVEPDKDRTHVCEVILNRVWGMAPQRISLEQVEPSEYEQAGVTQAIVIRPVLDVDSKEEGDPFDTESEDSDGDSGVRRRPARAPRKKGGRRRRRTED